MDLSNLVVGDTVTLDTTKHAVDLEEFPAPHGAGTWPYELLNRFLKSIGRTPTI